MASLHEHYAAGRSEALFREVNERIVEVADGETTEVLCECGTGECTQSFVIGVREYEAIREAPERFVAAASHLRPDLERVVEEGDGFVIVQKIGAAGEVARELDPRDG